MNSVRWENYCQCFDHHMGQAHFHASLMLWCPLRGNWLFGFSKRKPSSPCYACFHRLKHQSRWFCLCSFQPLMKRLFFPWTWTVRSKNLWKINLKFTLTQKHKTLETVAFSWLAWDKYWGCVRQAWLTNWLSMTTTLLFPLNLTFSTKVSVWK